MDCINEDRNNELENTILNIVQDAHNKAINECHHLVLELFDNAETDEYKAIYSALEGQVVELYKQ
jgi:hypothetical protein